MEQDVDQEAAATAGINAAVCKGRAAHWARTADMLCAAATRGGNADDAWQR